MPLYTHVQWVDGDAKHPGRHVLYFVNQQADPMLAIVWNAQHGDYVFDVSDEEALRIAASWGYPLDLAAALAHARVELPKADAQRATSSRNTR